MSPRKSSYAKDFGPEIRRTGIPLPVLPSEILVNTADFVVSPNGRTASAAQYREDEALRGLQVKAAAVQLLPSRQTEKEDRLEPGSASGLLVRGGRVKDPVWRMYSLHQLTKREMNAIEGFRDDVAIANGARGPQPESAGIRVTAARDLWPAEMQLTAMRRVHRTWDAMDVDQQAIANLVIMERHSLDAVAVTRRRRRATVAELLREVIKIIDRRHQRKGRL